MNGLFITGTDTDVGKTYIGVRLAEYLYQQKIPVQPRKPVETGCFQVDGILIPTDAMQYYRVMGKSLKLKTICPHRFTLAASPAEAALQEGQSITIDQLHHACSAAEDDFVLVEGAGGFYSPIATDGLNADLAQRLGQDVLVVAADRLGAINQVLLTVEAIKHRGLKVAAVILNQINDAELPFDNAKSLNALLELPIHSVSFAPNHDELTPIFKKLIQT